uniref:DUF753 domain-containing protein n=1 Tax=Anopheles culicifacies TaxID=139723 RepID=A0A182MSB5_9DIPT
MCEDPCITGLFGERIDRGCRNEMPQPIDDYIIIEECTERICNDATITDWASCFVCTDCPEVTSETDTRPCLNPATNRCYTKRESNGTITRGCASDDTSIGCDRVNCEVCDDQDDCNNIAVPGEFSCVQCDRSDERCADYNVLSECPNERNVLFDACVIHTTDDGITKGCLSSTPLFVPCFGSTSNNGRCNVTLESQGNARPVKCIDCKEDAACIRGNMKELPIANNFHGSCVSFLDESGKVVRGNVVDYPNSKDASHYVECFEDACNVGLFPEDRLLCYQCSGEECARLAQSALKPEPCLFYDSTAAKCYSWYDSVSSAKRGCMLDEAICQMEDVSCQNCTHSGCNDHGYASFSNTKECVKCTTNRACDESPTVENCSDGSGCYTLFSELLAIAKGCVSELSQGLPGYEECAAGSDRCEQCYGDLCNRNKCYVCNSIDGTAANCVEPSRANTVSSGCTDIDSECVAFIDDNGHTVRGCSDSFDQDQLAQCSEANGTCLRCKGDYCNGEPLPKNRIKCYQCSGTPECLNPPKNSEQYCNVYREGEDSCYTYFQDETTVERGCTQQRAEPCDRTCHECNTTACNDQQPFVQNTLGCAQCSGEDCPGIDATEPADVKPCSQEILLGRTDQCYTYFHPDETLERGCLSELMKSNAAIASQCLDASDVGCKLCNANGCNARSVKCFVCNTDTHPGCADNLDEENDSPFLQACGTGQCISLLDKTTTYKGCSEDLVDECESPEICAVSGGSMSNSAIYPADRLKCFQCQGGSTCEMVASSERSSVCQEYTKHDECYTYVSDTGETFRGCVSDLALPNPCIQYPDLCVRCNATSDCNTEPSKRSNELLCAQCTRASECEQTDRFERCTQMVLLGRQDSCYVHSSFEGEILTRGCLSDAAASLRDKCENEADSECSLCLCDRCNGAPVQCVSCEGETGCGDMLDANEENNLVTCQTGSCVSFVKHLTNGSSLIAKGCSELYERDTCGNDQGSEGTPIELCHSDACNNAVFPAGRLKCYQCEGESCSDPSLEPTICEPYSESEMCYSFLDRQQKGCLRQLLNATECEQDRCLLCNSIDGCNVEPRAQECISCSSKNDPTCIDASSAVLTNSKYCDVGGCVTLIDDFNSECSEECVTCSSKDGCNDQPTVVPNTRTCHHCEGVDCAKLPQSANGSVCPDILLGRTDACYSLVEKYSVRRGCLTEDAACDPADVNCHICTSGNDCNVDEYSVELHECIQCDEDIAGERCKWGFARSAAQQCSSEMSYVEVGCYTCYTTPEQSNADTPGSTSASFNRGCVGEERQAQCVPDTVHLCLGAGCNQRNEQLQICAKCEDDGCDDDRWSVEACRGIVPYERRGCYLMLDARKRIYARGCVADLSEDLFSQCSNVKDTSCITCLGNESLRQSEVAQNLPIHLYDVCLEDELQLPAIDRRYCDNAFVVRLPAIAELFQCGRQTLQRFVTSRRDEEPCHAPHQPLEWILLLLLCADALRRVQLCAEDKIVQHGRLREAEPIPSLDRFLHAIHLGMDDDRYRLRLAHAGGRIVQWTGDVLIRTEPLCAGRWSSINHITAASTDTTAQTTIVASYIGNA